jgi:hypothetical protein
MSPELQQKMATIGEDLLPRVPRSEGGLAPLLEEIQRMMEACFFSAAGQVG